MLSGQAPLLTFGKAWSLLHLEIFVATLRDPPRRQNQIIVLACSVDVQFRGVSQFDMSPVKLTVHLDPTLL